MISLELALSMLLENAPRRDKVTVPLCQSYGYTTAESIMAPRPLPAFAKSPYDGYAINVPSYVGQKSLKGFSFTCVGEVGAGTMYHQELSEKEGLRTMTGAPICGGANTVAMFEQCATRTDDTGKETIVVTADLYRGDNIIPIGEECNKGDLLLAADTRINEGAIAMLSGFGMTSIAVHPKPRILLLTSGRELVSPGTPLREATIYNSNGPMLKGLLRLEGIRPTDVLHISDDPREIQSSIQILQKKINDVDMVLSTGGVSIGDYDLMPTIFEALGAKTLFRRIAIRPGAAPYGGASKKTIFIGLSGNPTAAFNLYHLLAIPVLRYMAGQKNIYLRRISCVLHETIAKESPYDRYIQGSLSETDKGLTFSPVPLITSSALLGLPHADALLRVPQGVREIKAGASIEVLLSPQCK